MRIGRGIEDIIVRTADESGGVANGGGVESESAIALDTQVLQIPIGV